jgi:hypothetical protein
LNNPLPTARRFPSHADFIIATGLFADFLLELRT